jgi:hypothetical protein
MTGRTRLTWVTALTIMSMLLGGGALNAFADGQHGNKGHGNGSGKVEHQQQNKAADVRHDVQASSNRDRDRDDEEDADDLVTQPARVTDEVRPGKGCGDENHEHERRDECKDKHDGGGDDEEAGELEDE